MMGKIPRFHLICSSTLSLIWLLSNKALTPIAHASVLSNLNWEKKHFQVQLCLNIMVILVPIKIQP